MQQQWIDSKDEEREQGSEYVRGNPTLPLLPEWNATTGPIDLNDWISLIDPVMSDLTGASSLWWQKLMEESTSWYHQHLQLQPLDRISHVPTPSESLATTKWARLEKRASTMLLMAVPETQREELISSKRLTAMSIMCQLLVSYKPGGLAEKELILRSLESPAESGNLTEAIQSLRRWTRWRRRASELNISEPDPYLLLKGLNRIIKKPLESNRELAFRISLARSMLQVDSTPNARTVTSFAQHLMAEFEQIAHQEATAGGKKAQKQQEAEKAKAVKAKKLEEEGQGRYQGGKGGEKESERPKCKFYLTDSGCRRGKACTFSHFDLKDEKCRCWNCGCVDHMATTCTRPKGSSESPSSRPKAQKFEGEESPTGSNKDKKEKMEVEEAEPSMKSLLEEANKMLKTLTSSQSSSTASSTPSEAESSDAEVMSRLQTRLDNLKMRTAKMKVFKISQLKEDSTPGLTDSGATHPLRAQRPNEKVFGMKKVPVTLANGETTWLKMTASGTMVSSNPEVEPIIPMGHLVLLGCRVQWEGSKVLVHHPVRGNLPVKVTNGCPQMKKELVLDLIEEVEGLGQLKSLHKIDFSKENEWLEQLPHVHPLFRSLPEEIRNALAVTIGDWKDLPLNKRRRKKIQRDGINVHLYSGENTGFTLSKAWKQSGGDPDDLFEVDIKNGEEFNMLLDQGVYSGLLRLAMNGLVRSWIGGPNCRTRSVLRHYPLDWPDAPKPVRSWNGFEHGNPDLTDKEKQIVVEDDILLYRMLSLFVVSSYVRAAKGIEGPVGFALEQPASPKNYMPECVSFWDTEQWKMLKEEFSLEEFTFNQGSLGGSAVKPTTFGANLDLQIDNYYMKRSSATKEVVGSSKDLARWAPGVMRMISDAVLQQLLNKKICLRPMSWTDHIAHGHLPFRRDCLTCQQSLQQQAPHRKVDHPIGGTLSLDTTGPYKKVPDLDGYRAKYLLVGALIWTLPPGADKLETDEDEVELEEGAPVLEEEGEERQEVEDQKEEEDPVLQILEEENRQEEGEVQEAEDEEKRKEKELRKKAEEAEAEGKRMRTRVFKLLCPLTSKKSSEVTKATMDMILRLRCDGYHIAKIHCDAGKEFKGTFKKWCIERGIYLSTTAGDDYKGNGRCEAVVKSLKSQLRRLLLHAEVGSEWWAWGARYLSEMKRMERLGERPTWPPFLAKVWVRKRKWK